MAQSSQAIIFFAVALFLALFEIAHCTDPHFYVEGRVYCDTCRIQFVTKASTYIPGAKVRLECKNREGGHLTYRIEGETDKTGTYSLPVDGDHEEEVCEVILVKSPDPECNEPFTGGFGGKSARVSLTSNNGIASAARLANPLGFMKKQAFPECPDILKELGLLPTALE